MDSLMFDRVVEFVPGVKTVVLKNVSMNEAFFEGHFPGRAVMPGALIVEAMVQAGRILLSQDGQPRQLPLTSLKAKFFNPVFPGDQLRITVTPLKVAEEAVTLSAEARVLDKEAAKAELSFFTCQNAS